MASATPLKRLLPALLSFLAGPLGAAANLYCCVDEGGKQICADRLPQACASRAYRVLGESGRTVRVVEAPPTAEQRAQRAAEETQKKEKEVAQAEQRRQDQALLNTYGSEREIDAMRARAIEEVQRSIRGAEAKISETQARRKHFEDESEFYKKKTLPPEIDKGLRDTDAEIKAQRQFIAGKQGEIETINAKYDDDKRRYQELSRQRSAPR